MKISVFFFFFSFAFPFSLAGSLQLLSGRSERRSAAGGSGGGFGLSVRSSTCGSLRKQTRGEKRQKKKKRRVRDVFFFFFASGRRNKRPGGRDESCFLRVSLHSRLDENQLPANRLSPVRARARCLLWKKKQQISHFFGICCQCCSPPIFVLRPPRPLSPLSPPPALCPSSWFD